MDVIEHYLRDDELRSNELRVDLLNLKTKIIEMWSKCTFKSITKSMVTHSISFPGNNIHGFARSKKKKLQFWGQESYKSWFIRIVCHEDAFEVGVLIKK